MCHQNIVLRLLGRAASFEYVAGTIWQCEIELDHLALHCTAGGLLLYSWPGTTRLLATRTSHKSCHLRAVGRYENPGGIICIICPFSLDRVGWNPSIYNTIRWFAGMLGQKTCWPSISQIFQEKISFSFFLIDLGNSKLFMFIIKKWKNKFKQFWKAFFKEFVKKKDNTWTLDSWSMSSLFRRPSELAYYIEDWRIFDLPKSGGAMAPPKPSGTTGLQLV